MNPARRKFSNPASCPPLNNAGQAGNEDSTQPATPIPDFEAEDFEAAHHNTQTTYCSLALVILGLTAAGQALSGATGAAILEADGYSSYNSASAAEANVVGGFILLLPFLSLAAGDNEISISSLIYHFILTSLFSTAAGAIGGAVLDTGMSPAQHAAAGAVGAALILSAPFSFALTLKLYIDTAQAIMRRTDVYSIDDLVYRIYLLRLYCISLRSTRAAVAEHPATDHTTTDVEAQSILTRTAQ